MGRLIDEYEDIKTQQECVSKTIDTLWKMAQKYQQLQADYENRLKADMVAMLTELQLEIEEKSIIDYDEDLYDGGECVISITEINEIIQEKIDKLKENIDGRN